LGRHKRRRGGQPGNQNARKHGFYAANLTPEELAELWRAVNEKGTEPGLAVLHMKLLFVLRHDPRNPRLLRELARLYNKWLYSKYGDQSKIKPEIRKITRGFIRSIKNGEISLPEQIEAKPPETGRKTPERMRLNAKITAQTNRDYLT